MTASISLNPGSTAFINVWLRERSIDPDTRKEVLTPVNSASVKVTIKDSNGDNIAGVVWPVTVPFDANGNYSGTISKDAELVAGEQVKIYINATEGSRVLELEQFVIPVIPNLN